MGSKKLRWMPLVTSSLETSFFRVLVSPHLTWVKSTKLLCCLPLPPRCFSFCSSLVYLLLKISALWMSWVCAEWDGCGAQLPSLCFTWTQDLPFRLFWVLKSKPVCYHMVYQPPSFSNYIWLSVPFSFVIKKLDVFCELICTFKRIFVLPITSICCRKVL